MAKGDHIFVSGWLHEHHRLDLGNGLVADLGLTRTKWRPFSLLQRKRPRFKPEPFAQFARGRDLRIARCEGPDPDRMVDELLRLGRKPEDSFLSEEELLDALFLKSQSLVDTLYDLARGQVATEEGTGFVLYAKECVLGGA